MTTIVASFTNLGVPATGLAATIRVRRLDTGALVVTDAPMIERGDGAYSFVFAPVDGLDYSIRADGSGALPVVDRYAFGAMSGASEAVDTKVDRVHKYLGLVVGTPAVHTPTSVVAGSIAQTVGVVGPVVTKTATS